ncbi:hypothetical protein O203_06855 [Ectopseudomonas chengduensis]|nr:hypothetical protein O203_06855 [Pseudomonas chengduensis]
MLLLQHYLCQCLTRSPIASFWQLCVEHSLQGILPHTS